MELGTRGLGDVGRGDVGHENVRTQDVGCIGTRGLDKQTTPDFCAELSSTIFSALEKDSLPLFQLLSRQNSTNPAI